MLGFTKVVPELDEDTAQAARRARARASLFAFAAMVGLLALAIAARLWIFLPRFFLN